MRKLLTIYLLLANTISYAQTEPDITLLPQIPVYFDLGSYKLTNAAKHTIDSLIYADVLPPSRAVGIKGYADIIGGEESNMELSQKRSDAVAQYLRTMGIDSTQIEEVIGKGEVARTDKTRNYPQDRKVVILPGGLMKKEEIKWSEDGVVIATILFKHTTVTPYPYAIKLLDTVVEIMKKNPKMVLHADGYVCCFNYDNLQTQEYIKHENRRFTDTARLRGAERLSTKRADIIASYLKGHGIAADRIKCRAFGYLKNKMLSDGHSEHGANRVEIRALNK